MKSLLRSPWFILIIVLLASIAAPLNQFKVPPVLPLLMDAFHQSAARAGLLMSIFAFTGLLLAIPAGFIYQWLGFRATGLIAILAVVLGSGFGALSGSFGSLLISRFIEGIGMSFMTVVAPAVIALWFAADQRGKAMGIWAIWVPLGSTVMFLLAPALANHWGWPGVWWFGGLYAILVGFLYAAFIQAHPQPATKQPAGVARKSLTRGALGRVLRNGSLWLISLLFGCFNFVFIGYVTWSPTFLNEVRHFSLARASFTVSLMTLLTILSCPLAGWISDRIGSRKIICVLPMSLMAALYPLSFWMKADLFPLLVVALGFVSGFVPPGVFAAAVETVGDERLGGMAMAVIQIGQNAGMLLGPFVLGWLVESMGGWQAAFLSLAPVSLLGAVAGGVSKMTTENRAGK
jgi:MFS family permease